MRIFSLAFFALTLSLVAGNAAAQRVTVTMAGNGIAGFNGDGSAGYITDVNQPQDVCVDAAKNIYFIDDFNHLVRKISAATGLITTVAGGGFSGADGVPATDEVLNPQYMCIDAAGNLYFSSDNEIKKVTAATGIITTVAGTATGGYSGDGGAATAATMSIPQGICIDAAGNIYVADKSNNCIRKVTAATGVISTLAGTGMSGYTGDGGAATVAKISAPISICVNPSGDVFFSDQNGTVIREVNATTNMITTIAGNGSSASGDGGPATAAGIGWVMGMCCDGDGNIYCCDISCSCREIYASTGIINTVAGSIYTDGYNGDGGNALNIWFNFPHGVFVDAEGTIYIADQSNNRIRKSIQVTSTPAFAFAKGVYVYPCPGAALAVNDKAAITNMNAGEMETWTLISAPIHGSVAGLPYSATSNGTAGLTTPAGISYTSATGYTGLDSFKIMVSNGTLSDLLTIYESVGTVAPPALSGPSGLCTGASVALTESLGGGLLTISNSNAMADTMVPGMVWGEAPGVDSIFYNIPGVCMAPAFVVTVSTSPDPGMVSGAAIVCIGSSITLSDYVSGGTWSIDPYASIDASGNVTGLSSGMAIASYSVSNASCTAVATLPVTVGTPSGTISMNFTEFCQGTSNFVGVDVTGGIWSTTNGSVAVLDSPGYEVAVGLAPGVDTIVYTVTNSCGTAFSTEIVSVDALPDAGTISGLSSVYVGGNTTLTNTIPGGTWSTTNSSISTVWSTGFVTGLSAGTDSVVYTTSNASCSASSYFLFTVLPISAGVANNATAANKLTVMPNPAKSNFTVVFSSPKDEQVTITITDITGATLKTISGATNQPIDASLNVAAGVYLLNAATANGSMSGKIVIE